MKSGYKNILITKASGQLLPFSEIKLKQSLVRSGATHEQALNIVEELKPRLYKGVSTKKIYRWAFSLLKERSKFLAAKYRLKSAIMELGPSGYPFEKFIGEIMRYQGYRVRVGVMVEGNCVMHEVDVVAEKGEHHFMVECKYHNLPGTVCDVKIPLYIQSRFKDIEEAWLKLPGHSEKFHQGWVVTNTRFTGDAIQYGTCVGLRLIGWDYPEKESIRNMIDNLGLYPVTCLTSLTKHEKQELLASKIVLCREISEDPRVLNKLSLTPARLKTILDESKSICLKSNHINK